jgi:hypothetical protein
MGVLAVRAVARERGSPAVIGIPSFRPVALRPRLSTGLPLSLKLKCQIVADRRQVGIVCRGSQVVSHIGDTVTCSGLCSARGRARLPETSGAHQVPRVKTVAEIAVGDCKPGPRRVNEATVTRIDADVIDGVPADIEEHQVPGCELRERHGMCGTLLLRRGARDDESGTLVNVQRESAAIEASAVCTAKVVRGADERGRHRDNRASLGAAGRRGLSRCTGTAAESEDCPERDRGESGRGAHRPTNA